MATRDSRTPVYGIAVAAQLSDLPEATLRLFESRGLLAPARSDGGTRRYSDDDVDRLRRAAALRSDGLNIAGIARVLDLQDENAGLQSTNAGLRSANAGLRSENSGLRDENAGLREALDAD